MIGKLGLRVWIVQKHKLSLPRDGSARKVTTGRDQATTTNVNVLDFSVMLVKIYFTFTITHNYFVPFTGTSAC